ncbi:MAG: AtpZ/AtpI family protein [Gemmatimonadaceae bacterium]
MVKGSGVRGQGGKPADEAPGAGAYAGFGLQFVVALLLFLYLGQWADKKLGTSPIFLLIGIFVGAGGSFYAMYRKLMAVQAREEEARRAAKQGTVGLRDEDPR